MGKIKITLTKDELEDLYYNRRYTDQQIAALLDVGWKSVFNARHRLGISSNRCTISKRDMIKMYCEEQKTDEEIAEQCGLTLGSVYNTRKKYGISALSRCERHICSPTSRQAEIIYGTLLGDASISNEKHTVNKSLKLTHGLKQQDYLCWKYNELQDLCNKKPIRTKAGRWTFSTFYHPFFTQLRSEFYVGHTKVVNESVLKKITPLSLAVWFMDDGCNCNEGLSLRMCTCCFSNAEHILMKQWFFGTFEVDTRVAVYRGYKYLIIANDSRRRFVNLIRPHVIDSMKYKVVTRRLDNVCS